ncbi:MAG: branched-chain amino acid ABC transporter permease [Deltaproteobacteria bacterium]|nr:branched-chain amino acid ABC transporter permease [Deltaproteobacteria bacterium]
MTQPKTDPSRFTFRVLAALSLVGFALPLVFGVNPFILIFLANTFLYMLLALGLQLIFGYAGMIHLSQAAFFGIGAYASALVTRTFGWPFLAGMVTAILAAVLAGLLMSPMVRLKSVYFALASFAVGPITQVLLRELPFTGGANGLGGIPPPQIAGLNLETPARFYGLTLFVLVLFYSICHLLARSPFGLALKAIRQNELAARASGVDVSKMQVKVILIGVGAAGLAGSLVAHVQGFISPDMFSVDKSLFIIGITVVGGLGSLPGAVLGTALMMFVAEYGRLFEQYVMLMYGSVLALFMIFLPQGLWGLAVDAAAKLRLHVAP